MKSKILTKEEIEFLEKITEKILQPIDGKMKIDKESTKVHWWSGDGFNKIEWDEYIYRIFVTSKNGTAELRQVFNDAPLVEWAWHIAADAFHRLDDDINGPVAENLWPKDNNYLPDYKRLLE